MKHRPDLAVKKKTFIYFARAYPSGLIKIGYSNNPESRAHTLAGELGEGVSLLFTMPGGRTQELGFHRRFAASRKHGEWFYESGALHEFLRERKCAGTKVVIEKQVVHLPGAIQLVPVEKEPFEERKTVPQVLGYARVSTDDQVLDVQMTALQQAKCDIIFSETISAVNAKRPQFNLMLKHLEPGDTIIAYSFSRFSRDLKFLLTFIDEMRALGVTLKSTSEPHIDPFTTHGRLMVSMVGSVDEHERNRVKDRTKDAMAEKKRQGMYLGAPRKIDDEQAAEIKRLRKTMSANELAQRFHVSPSTVEKYAKARR